MFQGLACQFELIFGLLTITYYDLGDVVKALFQVVARDCEFIFSSLTSPKCDLCEVKNYVSSGFQALQTHFLSFDQPKMQLGRSRKSDV